MLDHKITYELWLTDSFMAEQVGRAPNRFHRWMLWLFFGFKIKAVK